MFGVNHEFSVAVALAVVSIVVLGLGLMAGRWARRGSSRKIIRDRPKR